MSLRDALNATSTATVKELAKKKKKKVNSSASVVWTCNGIPDLLRLICLETVGKHEKQKNVIYIWYIDKHI